MTSDSISAIGLITSIVIPWLSGSLLVYWLLRPTGRWNIYIIIGHGYISGLFLVTLVMRLWDGSGLPLSFWGISTIMASIIIIALAAIHFKPEGERITHFRPKLASWEVAVIAILFILVVYRFASITLEITLRPLYPWDAWMNWAPKAIVWYYQNGLTPWVSQQEWLSSNSNETVYTLGNWGAWKYPPTVPLIQLWSMLGTGASDLTLIYLPWVFVYWSLVLALYGHLKLAGTPTLVAVSACYLLSSLPYLNVHAALAGYADIWLATAFGLATFALHEWQTTRQWSFGLLAIFLAAACSQLKTPGIILGAIILLVFAKSLITISTKTRIIVYLVTITSLVYILLEGVHISIPNIGEIWANPQSINIPYIGYFELEYHPVHSAFFESLLIMSNWNILWYLLVLMLFIKILTGAPKKPPSAALSAGFLAMVFVVFVFYFTKHYLSALNHTTINRALMYTIPVIIFYLFISISEWQNNSNEPS